MEEEGEHKPIRKSNSQREKNHDQIDGRVGYKGTLKSLHKTKKDKFMQDGTQMLQVQKDIKSTEDKVRTPIYSCRL
jgi:hypothetical protein